MLGGEGEALGRGDVVGEVEGLRLDGVGKVVELDGAGEGVGVEDEAEGTTEGLDEVGIGEVRKVLAPTEGAVENVEEGIGVGELGLDDGVDDSETFEMAVGGNLDIGLPVVGGIGGELEIERVRA